MLRIQIPAGKLTKELISKYLKKSLDSSDDFYNSFLQIEGARKLEPSFGTEVWQRSQKSRNCSLEWVFAYLKNTLPPIEYLQLRKELFEDCLLALETETHSPEEKNILQKELQRKIEKRTAELNEMQQKRSLAP